MTRARAGLPLLVHAQGFRFWCTRRASAVYGVLQAMSWNSSTTRGLCLTVGCRPAVVYVNGRLVEAHSSAIHVCPVLMVFMMYRLGHGVHVTLISHLLPMQSNPAVPRTQSACVPAVPYQSCGTAVGRTAVAPGFGSVA